MEKAHYEVQRARRHDDRVDPDHRLVAGALERRWNDALGHVAEVEAQLATLASRRITRSDEQRHRLLTLGQDLTAVWNHPTAPEALKKRLRRTVLHAMLIDTLQEPLSTCCSSTGTAGCTRRCGWRGIPRGHMAVRPLQQALEVIRERSKVCRDQTIAATLHRLGSRTGTGKPWRTHRVACVRYPYRLPNFPKEHDWLTLEQAAAQLGVSATVIRRLIAQGTLPASQVVPSAPWIIHASDLQLLAVQTEVQAVQVGRRHPGLRPRQPAVPGQVSPQAGDAHAS